MWHDHDSDQTQGACIMTKSWSEMGEVRDEKVYGMEKAHATQASHGYRPSMQNDCGMSLY